jgi:hypothetical protein
MGMADIRLPVVSIILPGPGRAFPDFGEGFFQTKRAGARKNLKEFLQFFRNLGDGKNAGEIIPFPGACG